MSAIFPGRRVDLTEDLYAEVFPLGTVHIRKFSRIIAGALPQVASRIAVQQGEVASVIGEKVMRELLPFLTDDLFVLLIDCVTLHGTKDNSQYDLNELPHWLLPPIIKVWLDESFGTEDRWRPWMAAFEKMKDLLKLSPTKMPTAGS